MDAAESPPGSQLLVATILQRLVDSVCFLWARHWRFVWQLCGQIFALSDLCPICICLVSKATWWEITCAPCGWVKLTAPTMYLEYLLFCPESVLKNGSLAFLISFVGMFCSPSAQDVCLTLRGSNSSYSMSRLAPTFTYIPVQCLWPQGSHRRWYPCSRVVWWARIQCICPWALFLKLCFSSKKQCQRLLGGQIPVLRFLPLPMLLCLQIMVLDTALCLRTLLLQKFQRRMTRTGGGMGRNTALGLAVPVPNKAVHTPGAMCAGRYALSSGLPRWGPLRWNTAETEHAPGTVAKTLLRRTELEICKKSKDADCKVRDNQPTQFMNPRIWPCVLHIYIFAVLRCGKWLRHSMHNIVHIRFVVQDCSHSRSDWFVCRRSAGWAMMKRPHMPKQTPMTRCLVALLVLPPRLPQWCLLESWRSYDHAPRQWALECCSVCGRECAWAEGQSCSEEEIEE